MPSKLGEDLAELAGIFLGDGNLTKYFFKVYLNRIADKEYPEYVLKLCQLIFPEATISCRDIPEHGTKDIQISSKIACDYLRKEAGFDQKKRHIPRWILKEDRFIKQCIRGLFDTEGSVAMKYFNGKKGKRLYKQLTFTNSNEKILQFVEKYLRLYSYRPTRNSKKNIYLSNKNDIARYMDEIGSSNPKMLGKLKIENLKGFTYGKIMSSRL